MKTKSKSRRNVLGSSGFFLVLLLSSAARVYADDRASDRPAGQTKEEEPITRNEEPMRTDTTGNTAGLVGPSGEEIHDFLYPTAEDDKLLTRAN
jgi:hypothetical protein